MSSKTLQDIYTAFDPAHPLSADETNLYVKLDDLRGATDADIVHRLATRIRLSAGKPTCQVLAGHRGTGKTTELYRLQKELEGNDNRMFVVFCQADEDLDRNDVDFPDLLIAIVRQIATQLKDRAGISLDPGYFRDRLERLKHLFTSEVSIDKLDLGGVLGKVGVAIKGSPSARHDIRKLMEPDTGNLLHAANDVIGEAVQKLTKKGYSNLVVMVDDLDKMVVRSLSDLGCSTAEYLFVNRAAQLTAFKCHVIYTMPISLAYSHQENTIKASYGGHVPVVPMTKIATKPPVQDPHEPGIQRFRDIINRRLESIDATKEQLFSDASVQDQLIMLSGGQPFELMTLIRSALIAHGLPITNDSLERAQREGQREYARQLRAEHLPILTAVQKSGSFERAEKVESLFRELLESRALLQYVNDEEWYALNPMVKLPGDARRKPPSQPKHKRKGR